MHRTRRTSPLATSALSLTFLALVLGVLAGCSEDENPGPPAVDPELRRWRVPSEAPTIQAGMDSAAAGDTVLIAPGTYTGDGNRDLDFGGKAITIRGDGEADSVTLDCQGSELDPHRAFVFDGGEGAGSVVQGIRIVNGYGNTILRQPAGATGGGGGQGGAVVCDGASPTLRDCFFEDCIAYYGGAIYCAPASSPTITGCTFRADSSYYGVVYCDSAAPGFDDCAFVDNEAYFGVVYCDGASPTVTNSDFSGNVAYFADLYVDEGSPVISGCTFAADSAEVAGVVVARAGSPRFEDCQFDDNAGGDAGVGFFSPGDSVSVTFEDCTFTSNRGGDAGALWFWYDTRATLTDCVFTGNESGDDGGALNFWNESRGTITGCRFDNNSAANDGGAINFWNDAVTSTVSQSQFLNNDANGNGGAVNVWNQRIVDFDFCVFAGNEAPSGTGGAINLWNSTDVSLTNCTLWGNADGGNAAVWCYNTSVTLDITNTVIAATTAGAAVACNPTAILTMSCSDAFGNSGGDYTSCLTGLSGTDGNFSEDPLLCNPAAGDFGLLAGSPCIARIGCGQVGALGAGCGAAP